MKLYARLLIGASFEELIFRLLVDAAIGIWWSAFIFSLIHKPRGLFTLIMLMSVSLVSSYLFQYSIFISIGFHFFYNVLVILITKKAPKLSAF